jgi:hypothetical protein
LNIQLARLINKKHLLSIMDTATADKINQLAKSMKELHLSATMEEAYERAKEIILGSVQLEKSANEVTKSAGLQEEKNTEETTSEVKKE